MGRLAARRILLTQIDKLPGDMERSGKQTKGGATGSGVGC